MHKGIPIGIAVITAIGVVVYFQFIVLPPESDDVGTDSFGLGFTYEKANSELKRNLELYNISMSSPIEIQETIGIEKYCSFFSDPAKQKLVEYCTSTEILDFESTFLGNIHIVGAVQQPKLVIAVLQADQQMSQLDDVTVIFETVIETFVCDCWEYEKPGDYDTIGDWVKALREFHATEDRPHSKSSPITIDEKRMQIELTTNDDGYLWKLLVGR